jgi:hypothetical protein
MTRVYITRDANDTVNGVRRAGRVYVTGPHFGGNSVYSSTEDKSKATKFTLDDAERLLCVERKWMGAYPQTEEAE